MISDLDDNLTRSSFSHYSVGLVSPKDLNVHKCQLYLTTWLTQTDIQLSQNDGASHLPLHLHWNLNILITKCPLILIRFHKPSFFKATFLRVFFLPFFLYRVSFLVYDTKKFLFWLYITTPLHLKGFFHLHLSFPFNSSIQAAY